MSIAERFKLARQEVGLTQMQLCERSCYSQDVVQKIENGKTLRPRNIEKFAEILGAIEHGCSSVMKNQRV